MKSYLKILLCFGLLTGQFMHECVAQQPYNSLIHIPATFYDFKAVKGSTLQQSDFEIFDLKSCSYGNSKAEVTGMVESYLDSLRKPIPIQSVACSPTAGCACMIADWFRPSGAAPGARFYDSIVGTGRDARHYWRWTGLTRNEKYSAYVGPNFVDGNIRSNLVIYDSLPFKLINASTGLYQFSRVDNESFFWLDGKGYGVEPAETDINPNRHNFGFTMEIHHKFTYQGGETFEFTGDDDVWVFINGKLVLDLGGLHNQVTKSFTLSDAFVQSKGLNMQKDSSYMFDFFYAERHTTQSNCRITTNLVRPPTITKFAITTQGDTIHAGEIDTLTAVVIDENDKNRDDLAALVKWSKVDLNDSDLKLFDPTTGKKLAYTATKAWRHIEIRASITDPYDATITKTATARIWIAPAAPDHIVIEGSQTISDYNRDQPLSEATITDQTNEFNQLYAIARDRYQNYVRLSNSTTTTWQSSKSSVTAEGEVNKKYHGTARRASSNPSTQDTAIVTATEPGLRAATIKIILAPYRFLKLRLIDKITGSVVTNINMSTADQKTYIVQGLKSNVPETDPSAWVQVAGKWVLSDSTVVTSPPPNRSIEWTLDPIKPFNGNLTISNPEDATTEKAIIPITITLEPPTEVSLTILTPPNSRRAGDTIQFQVRIVNSDGLLPGNYCYQPGGNKPQAIYQDNLGTGGQNRPDPIIVVDGTNGKLNSAPSQVNKINQCFQNGYDTIKVVLYYAPANQDSLHRITAILDNRQAISEPFRLLPGALERIDLVNANGNQWIPLPDTIRLDIKGTQDQMVYVGGYDKWGNQRPDLELSTWRSTGNLDPISSNQSRQQLISAREILSSQEGNVCANANAPQGESCRYFILTGPNAVLSKAITSDTSGNGYLDKIQIQFNKPVPLVSSDVTKFTITSNQLTFTINSLIKINDSTYDLILTENLGQQLPQSAWRPLVKVSGIPQAENKEILASDGAQPVIWRVEKNVKSGDHTQDVVNVYFSENITNTVQGVFSTENSPALVFNVFEVVNNKFVEDSTVLKGIQKFSNRKDAILTFITSNGKDLTSIHFMNIDETKFYIEDAAGNAPTSTNRKAPVEVTGSINDIRVYPNPSGPTPKRVDFGTLHLKDEALAEKWVNEDKAGIVLKVTVTKPNPNDTLKGYLKIYDIAGNLVTTASNDDLGKDLPSGASTAPIRIYWNGSNAKGMKVAPGAYKCVVYLDYKVRNNMDSKLVTNIGIKK